MKALICTEFGSVENLELAEIESLKPAENQVLIEVEACGVNFPDLLILQNKYQFKPELPFSPGGEISGRIKAIGKNVEGFSIGDSVFALTGWGGFAENALAKASKTFHIPEGMDFTTAASTMYNCGTALYALKQRGKLQAGETLLVLGASGGVGLAAVQIGKLMGAKVIAAASNNAKLEICKAKGADVLINYAEEDLKTKVKEITHQNGVDVVFDPVGDQFTESAVRCLAWEGRYLVVGFAAGKPASIPMNLPLLKGAAIVGVFWGAFAKKQREENAANFEQILNWIEEGKLSQHLHKVYGLSESAQAIQDLMERKVIGKNVVKVKE